MPESFDGAGRAPDAGVTYLEEAVFTAFDVETTGLIPAVDRIVEIGAVRFSVDGVLDRFETLIDPEMPMPADARAINGITDEMVAGKPRIREMLPEFFSFTGDSSLVAHNAPFDVGFIHAAASLHGIPAPDAPALDTRTLAEAAFPRRGSYSLAALKRSLSIGSAASHRALADADACRELFLLCVKSLAERGIADLEGLQRVSGDPLSIVRSPPEEVARIREISGVLQLGESVEILYVSGAGEETVRRITPLSFCTLGGSPAVEAFCHLRGGKRTFRISSIKRVTPVPRE